MPFPQIIKTYNHNKIQVHLLVPEQEAVAQWYQGKKATDEQTPFPYWTQIWPASFALSDFIAENPEYITGKNVLEIAAGLGLPSMVAAHYAQSVYCTDYLPEAVEQIQRSIELNGLTNSTAGLLNWHQAGEKNIYADVLLLSDVNYEPAEFNVLFKLIEKFLEQQTTVLMSTPQRLMAKPFIVQLLRWSIKQEERIIEYKGGQVPVSILVLKA